MTHTIHGIDDDTVGIELDTLYVLTTRSGDELFARTPDGEGVHFYDHRHEAEGDLPEDHMIHELTLEEFEEIRQRTNDDWYDERF